MNKCTLSIMLSIALLTFLFTANVLAAEPSVSKEAPKSAQRIIALSPHAVELLFSIGAGNRIIGTLEYADYPKAALDIPRIGNFNGIQIEKVVELQPDLIIAWKSGNKASDLEKLASLGFKIHYSHPQNIDEISSDLIKLGELTGLAEKAKVVADKLAADYQQIINNYTNKPLVKVFYQLWHDPFRTIGPDNWNNALIDDCNGINIFSDADVKYPVVSLENVLIKNPEVIIIPHHSGRQQDKKDIWKKWQQISAVKNQNIFIINGDLIHRFGLRAVLGLEKLCEAIDSARD